MIEEILPPQVMAAEAFEDPADVLLFPEELAAIATSVERRRREFATGRECARVALGRLGLPAVPIVPGFRAAPQWPAGVVGSITHCQGYRAAAVARATEVLALGLDAEPHEALPGGVLGYVSLASERDHLAQLTAAWPAVHWDRLLFSAKEAVYKAWFPLTLEWLGFEEAEIVISPETGRFQARLLVPGPWVNKSRLGSLAGRWLVRDGLIMTAVVLCAPPASSCLGVPRQYDAAHSRLAAPGQWDNPGRAI